MERKQGSKYAFSKMDKNYYIKSPRRLGIKKYSSLRESPGSDKSMETNQDQRIVVTCDQI
jgi:hypothetical protein